MHNTVRHTDRATEKQTQRQMDLPIEKDRQWVYIQREIDCKTDKQTLEPTDGEKQTGIYTNKWVYGQKIYLDFSDMASSST